MKPILLLLLRLSRLPVPWLLICLWLVLGSLAYQGLNIAWRNDGLDQFARSMQIVSELAAQGHWQEPWESDPQWQRLEQRLNIDLVPLSARDPSALLPSNLNGESFDSNAQQITWARSPQGHWRASVTVPVSSPLLRHLSTHQGMAVRGTKEFDDQPLRSLWWFWWIAAGVALWFTQLIAGAMRQAVANRRAAIVIDSANDEATYASTSVPALGIELSLRQRLRAVLDKLREGVLIVDADGRIVLANSVLTEQLGLPTDQMEGRSLVEAIRIPRIVELLQHVVLTQQSGQQRFELSSGKRTLAVTASPIIDGESRTGALLTATDISSTQQSELARREFIAGASHELKTPLAAIRAYTETLQEIGAEDPDTSHRFLGNILEQADRMNRLVSSMMQLARAESGEMKLKLERIDAAAAIRPSIEAAVGIAQPKGQTVSTQLPEGQLLVMADRDALQTIASNLLSNAIRYTPSGGRIEVSLTLEPPDVRSPQWSDAAMAVCLRVTDTGIGISTSDQGRIFERFYRVQKDRALDSGGTGLGLSIVKQLTEVLGGSVMVQSQPGMGTRFEIWLPAVGFTQSSQ